MRNFEREPVWKLKESIWKLFLNSGRKHLFITGKRQAGKSSVINALLAFDLNYGGIVTHSIRKEMNKPNYVLLEDIHDGGINSMIGYWNELNNSMTPCLEGFEKCGANILNRYLESHIEWIIVDEIGFLESGAYVFQQKIRSCLQHKRVIAALSKRDTLFLEELCTCPDALLIDLDY